MKKKPLPCYLCGRPVVELGIIKWDRAPPRPDYITALHPVCAECVRKAQAQAVLGAEPSEATN